MYRTFINLFIGALVGGLSGHLIENYNESPWKIFAFLWAFLGSIVGGFASLFLKKGSDKFNLNLFHQIKNKNLILYNLSVHYTCL